MDIDTVASSEDAAQSECSAESLGNNAAYRERRKSRQLYDIPRVSKRQWVRRRFHHTHIGAHTHTYVRAYIQHTHRPDGLVWCARIICCSYAKRVRDLRLFCQPSRLSLVLRSLLCVSLYSRCPSHSTPFYSVLFISLPAVRVSFSHSRLFLPFDRPSQIAPSLSYAVYRSLSPSPLFLSLSLLYIARWGFGIIFRVKLVIRLLYLCSLLENCTSRYSKCLNN